VCPRGRGQCLCAACVCVPAQLASVFVTLDDFPNIRFSASGRAKNRVEELAKKTARFLQTYRNENGEFGLETQDCPSTLLIVDRVDDVAPALMHDFTYSSLVVDLLNHDPCSVRGRAVWVGGVCFVSSQGRRRDACGYLCAGWG
jgi:hypothetical protein